MSAKKENKAGNLVRNDHQDGRKIILYSVFTEDHSEGTMFR